jgi:hypothetical protein
MKLLIFAALSLLKTQGVHGSGLPYILDIDGENSPWQNPSVRKSNTYIELCPGGDLDLYIDGVKIHGMDFHEVGLDEQALLEKTYFHVHHLHSLMFNHLWLEQRRSA